MLMTLLLWQAGPDFGSQMCVCECVCVCVHAKRRRNCRHNPSDSVCVCMCVHALMTLLLWQAGPDFGSQEMCMCMR